MTSSCRTSTNCWRYWTSTAVADDLFVGSHPSKNPMRTFGGQLMAQSFVASSRTLTQDLPPSALSVHFINGGDTAKDIEFRVVRLRDERRFANRRVDAVQDGTVLSSAMISYMSGGAGLEHGVAPPEVAEPHTMPPMGELLRGYEQTVPHFVNALHPIEWRYTNDPAWVMRDKGDRLPHNRVWMKAGGVLPDDPVLHTAAMVYSSDTTVLDSVITTHGLSWGFDRIFAASANHSVWFHRQVDFNDVCVVLDVVSGGRRFPRVGHRALLRSLRASRRHGGAGRRVVIFSALLTIDRA